MPLLFFIAMGFVGGGSDLRVNLAAITAPADPCATPRKILNPEYHTVGQRETIFLFSFFPLISNLSRSIKEVVLHTNELSLPTTRRSTRVSCSQKAVLP